MFCKLEETFHRIAKYFSGGVENDLQEEYYMELEILLWVGGSVTTEEWRISVRNFGVSS